VQEKKVFVGTDDGAIELLTVKPSGKNEMSAQSWVNGLHLTVDEGFEQDNG
jgi:methionyl-tRNA formyltransferase